MFSRSLLRRSYVGTIATRMRARLKPERKAAMDGNVLGYSSASLFTFPTSRARWDTTS